MDFTRLDRVRRSATPLELDVVEALRERPDHAARSSSSAATVDRPVAAGHQRRHRRVRPRPLQRGARRGQPGAVAERAAARLARPRPAARSACAIQRPVVGRPGRDAGPRRLRDRRPVVRVPVHRRTPATRDLGAGSRDRVDPQRRRHRLDVQAPPGRQVAERRRLHGRRRRRDDGAPRRRRQLRPQGRPRAGSARSRPTTTTVDVHARSAPTATSRTSSRSTTRRRSSRRPTTWPARRSTSCPTGPAPGSSSTTTSRPGATFERNADWWGGQTPLDGTEFTVLRRAPGPMVTAYQGDQIDAIVQFDVLSGAALFDDPNFTPIATPAALHRQIWMRCDTGQFTGQARPPGAGAHLRPRSAGPSAVQGPGRARQRPRHLAGLPVLRPVRRRSGRATSTRPSSCWPTPAPRNLTATLHAGQLQEIPDLAVLLKSQAERGRHHPERRSREPRHVLRRPVVPGRAGGPAVLRCRGARHRRLRPPRHAGRLPQRGAQDERHLELVAVLVRPSSTRRSPSSRRRSASMPRRRPAPRSRRSSTTTSRSACRTSTTTSPATRTSSPGVFSSALGQMSFSTTSKVG